MSKMLRFLIFFVVVSALLVGCASTRNGQQITYQKNNGIKEIKSVKNYKDGKLDGSFKEYGEGQIVSEGKYAGGKLTGVTYYYNMDGLLKSECRNAIGSAMGATCNKYYSNGNLKSENDDETKIVKGHTYIMRGERREYYESGELKMRCNPTEASNEATQYKCLIYDKQGNELGKSMKLNLGESNEESVVENGRLTSYKIIEGNGEIIEIKLDKDGNGFKKEFFDKDNLYREYQFKQRKRDGISKEYGYGNKLKLEEKFVSGKLLNRKEYSNDGNLINERNFN